MQARRYAVSLKNLQNPYSFIAELIFDQAFYDIYCYYNHTGTPEEQEGGKEAIEWITKNDRWFKLYAGATGMIIEYVHKMCIEKIVFIQQEADERHKFSNKTQQSALGRETNSRMVSKVR